MWCRALLARLYIRQPASAPARPTHATPPPCDFPHFSADKPATSLYRCTWNRHTALCNRGNTNDRKGVSMRCERIVQNEATVRARWGGEAPAEPRSVEHVLAPRAQHRMRKTNPN